MEDVEDERAARIENLDRTAVEQVPPLRGGDPRKLTPWKPLASAPVPGRDEGAAMHTAAARAGFAFLRQVFFRKFPVGQSMAQADHPGVDVTAVVGIAGADLPAVAAGPPLHAAADAVRSELPESRSRLPTAPVSPALRVPAGLSCLGCIDTVEPDANPGNLQGVPVDDTGRRTVGALPPLRHEVAWTRWSGFGAIALTPPGMTAAAGQALLDAPVGRESLGPVVVLTARAMANAGRRFLYDGRSFAGSDNDPEKRKREGERDEDGYRPTPNPWQRVGYV